MSSPCSEPHGCLCLPGKESPGKYKSLKHRSYSASVQPIHASSITKHWGLGGPVLSTFRVRKAKEVSSVCSVLGGQVLRELRVRGRKQLEGEVEKLAQALEDPEMALWSQAPVPARGYESTFSNPGAAVCLGRQDTRTATVWESLLLLSPAFLI